MSDSYSGIINAFNTLRLANGAPAREYSDNYKALSMQSQIFAESGDKRSLVNILPVGEQRLTMKAT